jgi:hypothetical protein
VPRTRTTQGSRSAGSTPVGPLGDPTPGPWTATEIALGRDIVYGIRRPDGASLAMTGPEGHANARLLAAAPDLLDAVRNLLAASSPASTRLARTWAEAALTKATGEAGL